MDVQIYTDDLKGKWVRVSHDDVVDLNLQDQFTSEETRMSMLWVYLDARQGSQSDAAVFAIALSQAKPDEPVDYTANTSTKSSIRQMSPYCKALLKFALFEGRVIPTEDGLYEIVKISSRGRGKVFLERVGEAA